MRVLSGNHKGWLNAVAKEIREAGKPVSLNFLCNVVPSQFSTSQNDGHVTAAENGLSRDDYVAGQRIWVEEAVAVLAKAKLIEPAGSDYVWAVEQDGTWKVKFGRGTYTLYGRSEAALARDRHMLGKDDVPGYLLKGFSEVEVEIEVGADDVRKGRHTLQVHPLAFAIPPMSEAEQEQVRADIAEHGVRLPLTLYPDPADLTARGKPKWKVLDGRHRLQFASALGKPVRVEIFEGTEEEARQFVSSLNLQRRQLTVPQRNLAVERLFGDQARAEAKQHQIRKAKAADSVRVDPPEQNGDKSDGERWEYRAVEMAGSGSARGVRAMATVAKAPETAAKVDSGEIKTVSAAVKAAAVELGKPEPADPWETTGRTELGRARSHLRLALASLRPSRAATAGLPEMEQIEEARRLLDEIEEALVTRAAT